MEGALQLQVVTPRGSIVDEEVRSVTTCSELGEFGMLPGHQQILAALVAGRLVFERPSGERVVMAIDKGFLEGGPKHARVLVERCQTPEALKPEDLRQKLTQIEKDLTSLGESDARRAALADEKAWLGICLDVAESKAAERR